MLFPCFWKLVWGRQRKPGKKKNLITPQYHTKTYERNTVTQKTEFIFAKRTSTLKPHPPNITHPPPSLWKKPLIFSPNFFSSLFLPWFRIKTDEGLKFKTIYWRKKNYNIKTVARGGNFPTWNSSPKNVRPSPCWATNSSFRPGHVLQNNKKNTILTKNSVVLKSMLSLWKRRIKIFIK